jgi:hypothetical protein
MPSLENTAIFRSVAASGQGATGASSLGKTFWVMAYPAAGLAFHKVMGMASATIGTETRIRDLPVSLFAFDRDVLSLHRPAAFKEVLVDGNLSILHEIAQVRALSPATRV